MTARPHKWRDVAWKRAIADGARDAMAYFMPDLAADMDASREITGITGMELPVRGSDTDKDMRVSDVFLNVPVKGGEDWSVPALRSCRTPTTAALPRACSTPWYGSGPPGQPAESRALPYTQGIRKT